MSSQHVSKCCDALNAKGRNCRNYAIRGEKHCFQHKKKLSSKIIVHSYPAFQLKPIVFSNYEVQDNCCKYKNKYGENVCRQNTNIHKHFCDEHNNIRMSFAIKMKKLVEIGEKYKRQHNTIDSYMKLIYNIVKLSIKYKEYFVNFNFDRLLESTINMLKKNIQYLSQNYTHLTSPLTVHSKSKSIGICMNEFVEYKNKMEILFSNIQIKKARSEIVSNTIKVHKLSEIYLKSEISNEIMPVICKGIDQKILSFIV